MIFGHAAVSICLYKEIATGLNLVCARGDSARLFDATIKWILNDAVVSGLHWRWRHQYMQKTQFLRVSLSIAKGE